MPRRGHGGHWIEQLRANTSAQIPSEKPRAGNGPPPPAHHFLITILSSHQYSERGENHEQRYGRQQSQQFIRWDGTRGGQPEEISQVVQQGGLRLGRRGRQCRLRALVRLRHDLSGGYGRTEPGCRRHAHDVVESVRRYLRHDLRYPAGPHEYTHG